MQVCLSEKKQRLSDLSRIKVSHSVHTNMGEKKNHKFDHLQNKIETYKHTSNNHYDHTLRYLSNDMSVMTVIGNHAGYHLSFLF